jgi:hypothetical protein
MLWSANTSALGTRNGDKQTGNRVKRVVVLSNARKIERVTGERVDGQLRRPGLSGQRQLEEAELTHGGADPICGSLSEPRASSWVTLPRPAGHRRLPLRSDPDIKYPSPHLQRRAVWPHGSQKGDGARASEVGPQGPGRGPSAAPDAGRAFTGGRRR